MRKINFLSGIKKNVIVLGVASFFTDVSSEMLYPVIPIFLTSVLGAPMSILGFIEGVAESTASILKAFSGWLSDYIGKRRPFVVAGYSISSFAKPILFFAYTWPIVLIARFLDRFGKGLRTSARDAMIADSTEATYRGKAFGFHRAMDGVGAILGPLLAIWLLVVFKENLRFIFLLAFIPACLAILTLVFFLKETVQARIETENKITFNLKQFSPNFKKFLFASSIFAIGNSSDAFLIVRSKDLGLSMTFVILAYVLYNLSRSVLSTPFGILSDKMPRKIVMIIGYMIFALAYADFGLVKNASLVWLLFPVYGFYIAMTDGVSKAFVTDMVTKEHVGTAIGLYYFVTGIFTFFASFIAGLLWSNIGVAAPFLYGAIMAVVSSISLAVLIK